MHLGFCTSLVVGLSASPLSGNVPSPCFSAGCEFDAPVFPAFGPSFSWTWYLCYCWVKLKLLLQVYHQHFLMVKLSAGYYQRIRSTAICQCVVTGRFLWKKSKELIISDLAHTETESIKSEKNLSCLCGLLEELRRGWELLWEAKWGLSPWKERAEEWCTIGFQWMGCDEGEEKSPGKGIGVAASQDENSAPDAWMGLFLAPDQLDRRLSSFQWRLLHMLHGWNFHINCSIKYAGLAQRQRIKLTLLPG